MLTTLKEVLTKARQEAYAVPAFDCTEDCMIRPILDACEATRSPVILMALGHDLEGRGMDYIASMVKGVAGRYAIPIVLHLDHATDFALIERAVAAGFTSVMYDGSMLPLADNAARTRAAVELARGRGVSVEAELGHVAGSELDGSSAGEMLLTRAEEVAEFVRETRVDALAVSIGTAHGVYRDAPELCIERLREIDAVSPVPLVLHGGSGTPPQQLERAIRHGVTKLNIYADLRMGMYAGLKEAAAKQTRIDPLPDQLFRPIKDHIMGIVKEKIAICGSENRA